MRLKPKLLLGFVSILVIMAVFFGMSIYSLDRANRSLEKNWQERSRKINYSKTLESELNNISRYLRDLAFLKVNSSEYVSTMDHILASRERIDWALESLETTAVRDEIKSMLRKIRTENLIYIDLQEKIFSLASRNQNEEFERLINMGAAERGQIFKLVVELQGLEDQALNDLITSSSDTYQQSVVFFFISLGLTLLAGTLITIWITRRVTGEIHIVTDVMSRFSSIQDHTILPRIEMSSTDEIGDIALAFNEMARSMEEHALHEKEVLANIGGKNWLKSEVVDITALCQGIQDLDTLASLLITKVVPMIEAIYGVFYIMEGDEEKRYLKKYAVYAASPWANAQEAFLLGEGLVGQSALENRTIILEGNSGNSIKIISGLGEISSQSIILLPVSFKGQVVAVLEMASLQSFTSLHLELLDLVAKNIGTTINRVQAHMKIKSLLTESQVLTEELQSQSEELQLQQEELKTFNENLEKQIRDSEKRATELEGLKAALEEKARELEESSNYKTEFLSNMSHELRTPLNSLLILSQTLMENKEGNLTSSQLDYVKTIFSSGNELLALINDILDLSKVEAGKIILHPEVLKLSDLLGYLRQYFLPVANHKNIDCIVEINQDIPDTTCIDKQRLLQILKNLLSNAFKFTDKGMVSLKVSKAEDAIVKNNPLFKEAEWVLAFAVSDTGIGIHQNKQSIIFEAFQQANGTTARKYGGTGLGLTISQKLAGLLGGYIDLHSIEERGSTFTLYLPGNNAEMVELDKSYKEAAAASSSHSSLRRAELVKLVTHSDGKQDDLSITDNKNARLEGKKVLVVDDDMRNVFALTTALENQKIKTIFAENGRESIETLRSNPDVDLVLMDIMMPEMDGYEALRRIRQIPAYRNLPIIALTSKAMKNDREKCIEAGASDYISKPVNLDQLFSLIKIWLYR
ncbi:signal transduction histidine kinase [Desulfosporosinus orientis DSM 765]|uniref:Circadian input-output histidine kinase CikA n=1 Tax=Desulfosporosinus orientis (strain ATCC 19365 / DSM 765 / NCIMB 8382 / VKM B-1628 / Singapore I) TaxID=768706 RepID=G7W577_DESOD|nr:response regulator [Desulfosporosinus orientis]AET66093.1 signal transduction histidine kinase [Desulfosporosinus orientis DSM 765]